MRVSALILLFVIGALGGARDVHAEKVKTNQATKVRAKPGEQEKVLLKLKSGQTMTVLSKDGRWLKVRVQGRTGYVPRSTVDMPDDDEIARNTRRRPFVDGRSTKRGFGGEQGPDDRVGADATGEGADDSDSSSGSGGKATGKVAASSKGKSSDDDDDDDSSPAKSKPAAKATGKASASAKPAKSADDDDDDSPKAKVAAKPTAKPAAKAHDDDDGPKAKVAAKPAAKPAAKAHDDDDDDDSGSKTKVAAKGKGDDDAEDTTKVEDDDKDDSKDDSAGSKRQTAHVSAKVVAYNEHDSQSGEAFTAKPSAVLYPGETKGKWTFVETDDGDAGWVLSSQLDVDGGDVVGGSRRRAIALDAALGVTFVQQAMSTVGSTLTGPSKFPDSYTISTSALSIGVGGEAMFPYGKSLLLGASGTFAYAISTPGIDVPPMNGTTSSTNEGVTLVDINARAVVGYDFHKTNGIALFGRLGYRYDAFLVNGNAPFNVMKNPAKLPSEDVQGPTIGAAVAIPRLTQKVGIRLAIDAMLFGASVKQTTDLEDGVKPSAQLYSFNAGMVYRWKPTMDFQAAYLLGLGSYDFGAPDMASLRGHTGTDVKRSDIYNTVTVGLAKGF